MAHDNGRAARSAAWGVVAVVFGGGAVATWITSAAPGSRFPIWPAYGFGVVAAIGLYMCFASLNDWWPADRLHLRKPSRDEPALRAMRAADAIAAERRIEQDRPSQTEVPEKRETDVTPEQLTGFFKGVTDLQGQDRVARYVGGWMTVSGPIRDVGLISPTDALVHFADRSIFSYNDVRMRFREKRWVDALAPKNPGDHLIIRGQIESIESQTVNLDHCELLT